MRALKYFDIHFCLSFKIYSNLLVEKNRNLVDLERTYKNVYEFQNLAGRKLFLLNQDQNNYILNNCKSIIHLKCLRSFTKVEMYKQRIL